MSENKNLATTPRVEPVDPGALREKLGSADDLATLGSSAFAHLTKQVDSLPQLQTFLRQYQTQVLLPQEMNAVFQAWVHAQRNEGRELIALDRRLAVEPALKPFAAASQRVGRNQLRKLRPLKDIRVAQKYDQAVRGGEAKGWHTLVYGLFLSAYSLPLRQGLIHYGSQTMLGFIEAGARHLRLTEGTLRELHDDSCLVLPDWTDRILKAAAPEPLTLLK